MKTFREKLEGIKDSKQFNVGILFAFSLIILWQMADLIEYSQSDRFKIASLLSSGRVSNINWNPLQKKYFKLAMDSQDIDNERSKNKKDQGVNPRVIESEVNKRIHEQQHKSGQASKRIIIQEEGSSQRVYEIVTNYTANNELYERIHEVTNKNSKLRTTGHYDHPNNACNSLKSPSPLPLRGVNHISIDTSDVDESISFYINILGFEMLPNRPPFPFGGAWLIKRTSNNGSNFSNSFFNAIGKIITGSFPLIWGQGGDHSLVLHISAADPEFKDYRRIHGESEKKAIEFAGERYMRRGRHTAFTVPSRDAIQEAENKLQLHGIPYTKFYVPNTDEKVVQLFFYDPDLNGIEIGNYLQ